VAQIGILIKDVVIQPTGELPMYAVFAKKTVCFLGPDRDEAIDVLESKAGSSMTNVDTLDELKTFLDSHVAGVDEGTEGFSQAAERVFQMLDDAGINQSKVEDVVAALKARGDKAVAEVRSLGIRGMTATGEKLALFGELLKKAGENEDPE
jgi:hypothetical protein